MYFNCVGPPLCWVGHSTAGITHMLLRYLPAFLEDRGRLLSAFAEAWGQRFRTTAPYLTGPCELLFYIPHRTRSCTFMPADAFHGLEHYLQPLSDSRPASQILKEHIVRRSGCLAEFLLRASKPDCMLQLLSKVVQVV